MENQTTAIENHNALPKSYEEIKGMAQAFVTSGMFQDTKQLAQAIVKIQAGRELGLPPVYSMQNINLIRNRLTCSANTMAMLVKSSKLYNYRIKEHTDLVCTITFFERNGDKWSEVGEFTFSIEDARRADLVKADSVWIKYPRAMLFSRAISQGARIYAPDAIGGIYTDEEIRSIPPKPDEEKKDQSQEPQGTAETGEGNNDNLPPEWTPEETKPPECLIDLDWLKEQLLFLQGKKIAGWTNKDVLDFLNVLTNRKEKFVADVVLALNKDQAEAFTARVELAVREAEGK